MNTTKPEEPKGVGVWCMRAAARCYAAECIKARAKRFQCGKAGR